MNNFNPKSILITGGAGFIGANFIHYLTGETEEKTGETEGKTNARIVNLDKLTYAANTHYLHRKDSEQYKLVKGSITDSKLVDDLFEEYTFDCVVHFAAESHVDRSISGPLDFVENNIFGTAVLLETAKKHWQGHALENNRFHHISTDEVFGSLSHDAPAFTETTAYDPRSPYSASKAASDHLVRSWHHTYSLPVTISNCSNNYGPGQHDEKLIPTVIRKALRGEKIPVYGDGSNRRDWLFVHDHCDAIWTIIKQGHNGDTYAIGGGVELSNNEVINIICNELDKRFPKNSPHTSLIEYVTDRAGHDWRYAIDCKKINCALNWHAKYDFAIAIKQTIDYYINVYKNK